MREGDTYFPGYALLFGTNNSFGPGIIELREAIFTDSGVPGSIIQVIGGHQKLTKLDVAGVKVTDAHIDRMPAMPNLKSLDLRRTEITAEAVLRLAARMPQCKIGVDDDIRDKIKRLQKAKK